MRAHIIPLVEVVGGSKTSPDAVQQAINFYASIGKKPIHLKKELPGHVANRFQAALYREMLYVIEQGILSVEDTDAAVSYGPGLRWGMNCCAISVGNPCSTAFGRSGTPARRVGLTTARIRSLPAR
jgi:3-hydroxyacyl-CoA dehydrogenase